MKWIRFLLAASLLIPGGLFMLAAYHSRADIYREAERSTIQTLALLDAHALRLLEAKEQLLRRVDERLRGLSWETIETSPGLHAEIAAMAQEFRDRIAVVVVDPGGTVRLNSQVFPRPNVDVSDRGYFRVLRDADVGTHVSDVIRGKFSADQTFVLARRRSAAAGEFDGVILVAIYPKYLTSLYEATQGLPGSAVALLREDGAVLARSPDVGPLRYPADSSIMVGILDGRTSGVFTSVSPVDGTSRLAAYQKVGSYPLYVGLGTSTDMLEARWYRALAGYGAALLMTALSLFLLSWVALREVRRQQALKNELRAANEVLEQRVAERTADLMEANRNLNLLLKEVHHRVKNNLQIVGSFLGLQARALPPEHRAMYKESLGRIQAMSLIHEMLYGVEQFAHVDMGALLPKLGKRLCELYGVTGGRVRFVTEGKPLELQLDEAIPVALIANEVISNALKHAFPAGRSGQIAIRADGDATRFRLLISDDGIGFERSRSEGSGIGLRMIDGLCGQINAGCGWRRESGTHFELTLDRRPSMADAA